MIELHFTINEHATGVNVKTKGTGQKPTERERFVRNALLEAVNATLDLIEPQTPPPPDPLSGPLKPSS